MLLGFNTLLLAQPYLSEEQMAALQDEEEEG